jgi:alanine racemase
MDALGRVEIDLAALAGNYATLTRESASGATGAVVKADAYGLGIAPIAQRLAAAGCRHFFVATPREAVELRGVLADPEIFVLDGLGAASREAFIAAGLTPVLNTPGELARWGSAGPAAVHIDTGMNRLGLGAVDIERLEGEPELLGRLDVRYVLTHLACADEPGREHNAVQLERFHALRALWPDAKLSIGNSAGMLLGEGFTSDLARPGIALYGANPFRRKASPVRPVVTVKARILELREIAAGASVGYGASFTAAGQMRIATVAIGYADGYLRSLGNCGVAEVAGQRVPVVGRVSMDLVTLDVTAIEPGDVAEGDWATMIGGSVSLEELAALAGTINYELLTALGSRLERVYIDADNPANR